MDLLNNEKITHIIIFIFILLSLTYLYDMNSNTTITNKNKNKTITENFIVLSENQEVGANEVIINNLTQVKFLACGRDSNGTNKIVISEENIDWENDPLSLQDIFDTKLNNSGIIGNLPASSKNIPLQGIVLSDAAGTNLVKIGAAATWGAPVAATTITSNWIQFGGNNLGKEFNSARISAGLHEPNSLNIVGMSEGTSWNTRQVHIWAEKGLTVKGPTIATGGVNTPFIQCNNNKGSSPGVGYFNGLDTGWLSTSGDVSILGNGAVGPYIKLRNESKNNDDEAAEWRIYNMYKYGAGSVGGPGSNGNSLSFWKYSKKLCVGGLCTQQFTLNDDGSSYFAGPLRINGETKLYNNLMLSGNPSEIRKDPASGNPDLHLVTDRDLYLMAKANTYIYKEPGSDYWNKPSGNLIVQGNLTVQGTTTFTGGISVMPRGCIIMYHGSAAPAGWAICDGGGGTPDLRGKFVLGISPTYWWGRQGGAATVTLTEAQMPRHNHPFLDIYFSEINGGNRGWMGSNKTDFDNGPMYTPNENSDYKGGGQAHENMPPYYTLLYIMKL